MYPIYNKIANFMIFIFLISVISCSKISVPEETTNETVVNTGTTTVNDTLKGVLLFHENFQKWAWRGYLVVSLQNCETDLMKSASVVSYIPTAVSVIYDTLKVDYSLIDFAVSPTCGNAAGTSTDSSEVSTGYVALQCPIYYTCGHYSKGDLITSSIPSVSYVEFTVSYPYGASNNYPAGVSLWKKADGDADTIKVGTYVPADPLKGQKFTVKLNAKNVTLKFKSEKNSSLTVLNESMTNRAIRIHDLYVWKPK
jgi:hypothetical protein